LYELTRKEKKFPIRMYVRIGTKGNVHYLTEINFDSKNAWKHFTQEKEEKKKR